jgi:hypothetical protein
MMAKREFKITYGGPGTALVWEPITPVRGLLPVEFFPGDVHESLRDAVFAYGVKQIIADGGALEKGAGLGEKVAMMEKRADALRNGTWGTRQASAPKITDDLAIATLAKSLGKTPDEIRAMLGQDEE